MLVKMFVFIILFLVSYNCIPVPDLKKDPPECKRRCKRERNLCFLILPREASYLQSVGSISCEVIYIGCEKRCNERPVTYYWYNGASSDLPTGQNR